MGAAVNAREPYLAKECGTNRRLTLLYCWIGRHTGHFAITRVEHDGARLWGCDDCIRGMAEIGR